MYNNASFLAELFYLLEELLFNIFGLDVIIYKLGPKRKLSRSQKSILETNIDFYTRLNLTHQIQFEHRLSKFISSYEFIGRGGYVISDETRVLIGASYTKLTFGKRKYLSDVFSRIIVYPQEFKSSITRKVHKGEFNPRLKTVVFSWKDFLEGERISNDNLNLGIHEFSHVLHIRSKLKRDASSRVFRNGYFRLIRYLRKNASLRKEIIESNYFRIYAFENQYEFMAVLLENFIETPQEFKRRFPKIYKKIKRMLNFHFLHY